MPIESYLARVHCAEMALRDAFDRIRRHHPAEPEISFVCVRLTGLASDRLNRLQPFLDAGQPIAAPLKVFDSALRHDLQSLCLLAEDVLTRWTMLESAAEEDGNTCLLRVAMDCAGDAEHQIRWLRERVNQHGHALAATS